MVTSTMVGTREPEGDTKFVRARLGEALQADGDRHGVAFAPRHRQREHHQRAAAHGWRAPSSRWPVRRGPGPPSRSSVDVLVNTRGWPALAGLDDRDGIDHRIGFDQIVQRVANIERVERERPLGELVGGRSRGQPRRVDEVAVDVVLERPHFQVRHARDHAEHDEPDRGTRAACPARGPEAISPQWGGYAGSSRSALRHRCQCNSRRSSRLSDCNAVAAGRHAV